MPPSPAETSLADLAINELGNRLPSLLPHLLGFELVTKNDESSRAAGLLGFDIGGSQVLIPALFLNGKIKGMDSIFIKDSDTFVAASPEWAEFLTSSNSGVSGEAMSGRTMPGVPPASLRIFNQPPQIAKRAQLDEIFEEFMNPAKALAPDAPDFNLPSFMRSMGKKACLGFMRQMIDEQPALLVKMANFYPGDALKVQFPDEPKPVVKTAELAEPTLAFVTLDQVYASPAKFTTEQKEAVFRDGLLVIDKRAADEKSSVYPDDYTQRFGTPTASGFYRMLNQGGELVDVFIGYNSFLIDQPNGGGVEGCTIIDPDSGLFYMPITGEEVLVRSKKVLNDADFSKEFKKLSKISSATANKTYVAVTPKGDVSAPFRVNSRDKSPDYLSLRVETISSARFRSGIGSRGLCCHSSGQTLRVIDAVGGKLHRLGNIFTVPSEWRIMEVTDGYDHEIAETYEARQKARDLREKKRLELTPGSLAVLSQSIQDKAIKALEMTKKNADYTILLGGRRDGKCTPRLKKNAALSTLVGRFGLSMEDANGMLDRTETNGIDQVWIKMAAQYGGMPFPDDTAYTGSSEYGVPETQTVTQQMQVPIEHPEVPDATNPDLANFDKIKQNDIDFLSRAADANAKNVFDPAMIGTILKSSRTQAQVDQWLPALVGSLDKLCRLSLLFYWKNADFAEMYGKDEMSEFEDVLLNSIKVMGTIVLFLKQRANEDSSSKVDALRGGQ